LNKCEISNVLDCFEDPVVLRSSSLDEDDNRNDQCGSSEEDFRGFYDQLKLHAVLPFC